MYSIGTDIGGTFTDCVVVDDDGAITTGKAPSTPPNFSIGFFDAITNGWGAMPGYAAQIPVADRWAIITYVRALQLSQQSSQSKSAARASATTDDNLPVGLEHHAVHRSSISEYATARPGIKVGIQSSIRMKLG